MQARNFIAPLSRLEGFSMACVRCITRVLSHRITKSRAFPTDDAIRVGTVEEGQVDIQVRTLFCCKV